ncbi:MULTISPECIES: hypothetical protein [Sphingobium]|uniref:Uncharacterized protein n=1 Tax=Sphingobium yanoikuyae ATCC 51230 TaxID=883163 RepID=K9CPQ5_SPHYA|nr:MULTISPECIES: hypothetical protein [Sphingobium]EKU74294.1 hypothetical protein HMPREF9718_01822 [Sphingobium yanoikuyae ATCC 51230]WQE06228.1 hypothetical protein U0025_18240 [Sphingobium yanoikuyae]SHM50110.1 hypothetical protein SAMN05518668_11098 [Sphingobium sp. YR657]
MLTELLKILGQGVVAAFVSWVAIFFALSRYKSEKIYDRVLGIYTDAIALVSEMAEVTIEQRVKRDMGKLSDQENSAFDERYRVAADRLKGIRAVASILAPPAANTMEELIQTLQRLDHNRDLSSLAQQFERVKAFGLAQERLVAHGQESLG